MSRRVRNKSIWLPLAAMSTSLVLSVMAIVKSWPGGEEHVVWKLVWPLAEVGGRSIELALALDPLAALMLFVVTFVGTCVQVYSIGYMHKDDRIGWYFSVLSLFTSAMLVLVLSENLLLTFAMWEMMGLCSYLLIGFWYELEGPRKASQKAFLTTRVGDLGFLIALFAIFGAVGSFEMPAIFESAHTWPPAVATVVAVGLLWAAMGKSAQVPLHVWLPDAMAGPTPASALIHAATMVAAGVFVIARMLPVIELTGWVMTVMLAVGATTAVVGGLLACVQHDVKKVLAYSTISQLGLMFVALGAGSAAASLFHLTTHAFFKSLLFLGAGVIIHAAHTQDMREMGGLARYLPITTTTFTVGGLALAGVFPLAGFFSKDEILTVVLEHHHYLAFAAVVVTSSLTAFYMTRLWFRVFTGPQQAEHLHEGHKTMVFPMVALALVTAGIGFAGPTIAEFLGHEGKWPELGVAALSTAIAFAGIGVGWWFYGRRNVVVNTRVLKMRFVGVYGALVQKLYFDSIYELVFIRGYFGLAAAWAFFDSKVVDGVVNGVAWLWTRTAGISARFDGVVIDGAVNAMATISRGTGTLLRRLQTGRLQNYQRLVVGAVLVLMLIVIVTRGA
jgi:NADH-quinone oxidoreductase subunit L